MISDAELLSWTKADEADTDLLRALERAAVLTIQHRTGRYWGVEDEIVETRFWRGGPIELQVEPTDGTVAVEYWDGSAWAAADASTFYVSGRFLRAAATPPPVWPATTTDLRLTYTGGATVDAGDADVWDAPEDIKLAVRLLVAHLYLNRETVVVGVTANEVPFGVDALIRDHRRASV
jgi:uncharacterized phiE125 gp8 family phage protein